jgi:hypothetical protein
MMARLLQYVAVMAAYPKLLQCGGWQSGGGSNPIGKVVGAQR